MEETIASNEAKPQGKSHSLKDYLSRHKYWILFSFFAVLFLYFTYYTFCYKDAPDLHWTYWNVRTILFRVYCGIILLTIIGVFCYLFFKKKLDSRKACICFALMAMVTAMCYSFATPIWDYGIHWNQHDDYYASAPGQYLTSEGFLDGGGGHFGMIMTVYRYLRTPEIQYRNGAYDFSVGAVLERYQPKTFYWVTGLFMRWNSLFVHAQEGTLIIKSYEMTYTEWALLEMNRVEFVAVTWISYYFLYRVLQQIGLKGKGLVLAYLVAVFCPIFFFFANWENNDGLSAMFALAALYRGFAFFHKKDWKNCLLCAFDIGVSMSCKLGGAIAGLVLIPTLLYGFIANVHASKGKGFHWSTPWVRNLLQGVAFAAIVFPIGLAWPIWSLVRFGQPIFFFSDVANPRLKIDLNLFQTCFVWPSSETFGIPFVFHYIREDGKAVMIQDYTLTSNVFKKALFNEYSFGGSLATCTILYSVAVTGAIVLMLATLARFVWYCFFAPSKKFDGRKFTMIASALIMNWAWATWFVAKSPYTCNCDLRYIPTFLVGVAALAGDNLQSLPSQNYPKVSSVLEKAFLGLGGVYGLMVMVTYVSLFAGNVSVYA